MARVNLPNDLQAHTGGAAVIHVAAKSYRDLVAELIHRFPGLSEEIIDQYALGIDGTVIPKPLFETFDDNSELVLFSWIQGG